MVRYHLILFYWMHQQECHFLAYLLHWLTWFSFSEEVNTFGHISFYDYSWRIASFNCCNPLESFSQQIKNCACCRMFRLMPTQINNEALFLLILNRSYYIIKRGKINARKRQQVIQLETHFDVSWHHFLVLKLLVY